MLDAPSRHIQWSRVAKPRQCSQLRTIQSQQRLIQHPEPRVATHTSDKMKQPDSPATCAAQ
eukprot:5758359-Prymnesium_polylepis.1